MALTLERLLRSCRLGESPGPTLHSLWSRLFTESDGSDGRLDFLQKWHKESLTIYQRTKKEKEERMVNVENNIFEGQMGRLRNQ